MMMDEAEERMMNKRKLRQRRWQERQERSKLTREEVTRLRERREELRRTLDAKETSADEANAVEDEAFVYFSQLPLSQRTQLGLERGHYKKMTPIQREALHLALAGYDVLGAAKTGSGKTLCFVLPVLERLLVEHWEADMGVGALILSPTRELALQIFKVMQVVGYKHVLSAALLTGGRDVEEERRRLHAISIIVGTPGRVLHHLQDDAELRTDNLQIFCMDEADRLLDMGFREALTNILKYLPQQRQTLLFSATQSTDVQMLAQIALHSPRYVSAHGINVAPTPQTLCQNFVIVELHRKLDVLHLFLKRHPNDKIVVFVSTCNQVKYMYLAFAKILKKTRIPSMCLTSKMKQFRREEVFLTFCRCKSAVLFCTDVAARGLDFPLVHWVVQYDCPESAQTYIHRAGRTARAGARGVSLLFLTPQETPMLSYLAHKNIPLREVAVKPFMLHSSHEVFVALVVQGLKYQAQKAFIAYLRSVYFAANKHVFQLKNIDVEAFARSLGLLVVPDMSELQQLQRSSKNLPWDVVNYIARRDAATDGRTRKERHLQASDMFRTLELKQERFGPREGRKGAAMSDDNNDDEDDDTFLVKKVSAVPPAVADASATATSSAPTMHLTAAERLAGLSRNKRRKFVENADLRVRDLHLNTHVVFADSDDDDDDDDAEQGGTTDAHVAKERRVTTGDDVAAMAHEVKLPGVAPATADDTASDTASSEGAFAARLRSRVEATKESDVRRARQLRRLRRLKKEGRVPKKASLADNAARTVRDDKEDDDDDGSDYGSASDVSTTSSLAELARTAARTDEEEPVHKKPRHA